MQTETVLDLRYNIAAMYIAILSENIATPEQAFAVIEGEKHKLTHEDTLGMVAMHLEGMTYKDIGEIYGINWSTAAKRIQRYKKDLSSGNLKRSAIK